MKKIYILPIFIFYIFSGFAETPMDTSSPQKWKDAILKDINLDESENISWFDKNDLSYLLMTEETDPPIGFIGENYDRFDIFYSSVKKIPSKKNVYLVKGKTRVKQNILDFKGTMTLANARYYIHKSDLGNYPDSVQVGVLTGTYYFEQDNTQFNSGKVQGFFAIRYYTDPAKHIYIDDWKTRCANYYNQQYVGTWTSYDGGSILPCNWGSSRIPACGDLDIGKNSFFPDEKYKSSGWDQYQSPLNMTWWK